ncbi:MAG: heparan-alpha-glucosaminide N-acetyltransferase domain-containing protein, partial [Deinococcus sp.]
PRARPLLLGAGLLMVGVGWLWAGHLEFNKAVWTPSYVVYASGLATLGVALFSLIGDSGSRRGAALLTPLTVPGRNALFAYVAPILIKVLVLTDWQVSWTGRSQTLQAALLSLLRGHLGLWYGGWVYTLGYILLVWLGLALLARRGLVWKL